MEWISVQISAAMVAGVISLNIGLLIALAAALLGNRKARQSFALEFAAEGVARELLLDRKWPNRPFCHLKYHLGGFSDDELRRILVRAGGIRLSAGGEEVWGLPSRNREHLGREQVKEAPENNLAGEAAGQVQGQPLPDVVTQDLPEVSRDSSGAFERVRAEMIKLGTLECVRPAVRQE